MRCGDHMKTGEHWIFEKKVIPLTGMTYAKWWQNFHISVNCSFNHLCKLQSQYVLMQIFIHSDDMSAIVKVEGKHMNHIIFRLYSHKADVNMAYLRALEGISAPAPPPPAIFSISLSFPCFPPFSYSLPFPPLPSPLPHLHPFLSSLSFLNPPLSHSLIKCGKTV